MAVPPTFGSQLALSLERQERIAHSTLILNPVENFPFADDLAPASGFLHGLYNTDKIRTPSQQRDTVLQFAGRGRISYDVRRVYEQWSKALGAADVTMRLLSGLQAHATVFMSCSKPGQRVLLLPERAGGHVSTKAILERLGLVVTEMVADDGAMRVDLNATLRLARDSPPDFVFVDRSEGLVYEDFSELIGQLRAPAIFDASQYLSNVLVGDFESPFSMGFGYLLATLHKNFPGPQKALLACREKTDLWAEMLGGISTFVSNMHVFGIYTAGFTVGRLAWLKEYSHGMALSAVELEGRLAQEGFDMVRRPDNRPATHHVWLRCASREQAFSLFKSFERCRILTNFRKLPYNLGFGLRLGLSSAVRIGFKPSDSRDLAKLFSAIAQNGATANNRARAREFNESIWSRYIP